MAATLKDTLKLHVHLPTRVVVDLVDGTQRELLPAKDTRKRWLPIVEPMEKLDWSRVELFKGKATVAVIDNPERAAEEVEQLVGTECCAACGKPFGGDDLDRMLRAMTAAAQWQDKSVERAMGLNIATIENMNEAITGLVTVHRLQLEAVRAPRAAVAADAGDPDDIVSILPALAAKLLGAGATGGLTPEQLGKLGAFVDAMPAPKKTTPAPARPKHATPKAETPASTPAKSNGANGAH